MNVKQSNQEVQAIRHRFPNKVPVNVISVTFVSFLFLTIWYSKQIFLCPVIRRTVFERARSANVGQKQVSSATRTDHVPVPVHHTDKDETKRLTGKYYCLYLLRATLLFTTLKYATGPIYVNGNSWSSSVLCDELMTNFDGCLAF